MSGPLHASEATCYLRCPREHQLAYGLRRVPRQTHQALSRGTSVHRCLNAWWGTCGALADGDLPTDPIARACCLGYQARYSMPHLEHVRVEVPWEATLGGVRCAGTVDAVGFDEHGDEVIVEHKTTSLDIGPGAIYWRQVAVTDVQVSMYAAAFPGARVLYDVVRKPDLEHSQVPVVDSLGIPVVLDAHGSRVRKTTGDKGWRRTGDKEKGYVLQTRPETDDELVARCLAAMAADPARYFARSYIVRLEHEHEAFTRDLQLVDGMRRLPMQPRSPRSCYAFGRECGFYPVCWEGRSIDDDTLYTENTHGMPNEVGAVSEEDGT